MGVAGWEVRAGGWRLEAGGWTLEAGGWRLGGGGWRLGIGGWRLEAGRWRLVAGGWRLEAGGWRLEVTRRAFTCSFSFNAQRVIRKRGNDDLSLEQTYLEFGVSFFTFLELFVRVLETGP